MKVVLIWKNIKDQHYFSLHT